MKYNVGDKVRIKSIDWYNKNKDIDGDVSCGEYDFVEGMKKFCSETFTISDYNGNCYLMLEDSYGYVWTDEMIEGLVEEDVDLIPKFGEFSDNEPLNIPTMTTDFIKAHGFPRPEGYIFKDENGNEILTSKIILEKKKKEYPKTYEECCEIIHSDPKFYVDTHLYSGILGALYRLLICRDAYWKIAGEEMGLGKTWEPDWKNGCYVIFTNGDGLIERDIQFGINAILAFPTEEMRDAFYENFKSDIEICKEFL